MEKDKYHASDLGCKCQRCGIFYKMDLLVNDALWSKLVLRCDGGGLLCPSCIVKAIEKYSGFSTFNLIPTPKDADFIAKEDAEFKAVLDHAVPPTPKDEPGEMCEVCGGSGGDSNKVDTITVCGLCRGLGKIERNGYSKKEKSD